MTKRLNEKTLRFTEEAWKQLEWMCKEANTEIGFFGVADDPDDLFLVTRLMMPKQECTSVTVVFDDDDLAAEADKLYCEGLEPRQVLRIWIHTHPGNSATPSGTDWQTFGEKFDDPDWAVMAILAKGGDFQAYLRERNDWYPEPTVTKIEAEIIEDEWETDEWKQLLDDKVEEENIYTGYTSGSKKYGYYDWAKYKYGSGYGYYSSTQKEIEELEETNGISGASEFDDIPDADDPRWYLPGEEDKNKDDDDLSYDGDLPF